MNKVELLSTASMRLSASIELAQNDEAPAASPFVLSLEDAVRPGMMAECIESMEKWIGLLKRGKIAITFNTFLDSNDIVNYLEPMSGITEIDIKALNAELRSFQSSTWGRKRQASLRWSKYSVWLRVPQLSYRPANPNYSPTEMPYFIWKHIRLRPETESKFTKVATAFKKLFEKRAIARSYGVFCIIVGYECPWYTVVFPGKNPGDLHVGKLEIAQRLGAELKPVLDELCAIAEEITEGSGWAMPKLSLPPN